MITMVERAVQALGGGVDPWVYLLLFAVVLLESSAFIGLFELGEEDRLTFNAHMIETGTESYRLRSSQGEIRAGRGRLSSSRPGVRAPGNH